MERLWRLGYYLAVFALVASGALSILTLPANAAIQVSITRTLTVGSSGPDVSALQQFLKDEGYFTYPAITGFYGAFTWKAVAAFQWDHRLEAVGFVGPKTRALIALLSGKSTPPAPVITAPTSFVGVSTTPSTSTVPVIPPPIGLGNSYSPGYGGGGGVNPDITVPSVVVDAPADASTVGGSVTLSATASDNIGVASVQFKVDSTNIGSAVTSAPYTTAWDSTGVADGAHTLYAVAEDTSGNVVASSVSVTVDNTAPVISSIATTSVATSSAVVSWTTDGVATSKVVYGATSAYGSVVSNVSLLTSHSMTLSGLTASTTYHFAVVSTDATGNAATSTDKLFTTQTGLLGVNISGPEFSPWNGQAFPTSADFAYLQSKGVSFVRLPVAWESLQPTLSGALDTTYLGKIQTAIANAYAHNLSVIVDVHNFGSYCNQAHWVSSGCGYAGNAAVAGTGVNFLGDGTLIQSNFTDLWTRLSTALAGSAGLKGYEIMNEPAFGLLQYGTNLLFAPNGFGDTIGAQPWFSINGAVVTQLGNGTNPLGSNYGPAWSITSGTGFGARVQSLTLSNVAYTLSCYAKTTAGTDIIQFKIGNQTSSNQTINTTWTRYSYTATPSAGASTIYFGPVEASGHTIQVANCQLELGSSATAYVPNPWSPYAQAAITAIRTVDATTPIYVSGFNTGRAFTWEWENWDLATLTGGNLIFDAHQYFDGTLANGGGGGTYSGTYSSYSITSTAGVSDVAPFVDWIASTTLSGFVGEYAIPDNSRGDQASWLPVMTNFLQNLIANNIPSTMWFYGTSGLQPGNNLGIATSTTANAGSDDVRLLQMLQQY